MIFNKTSALLISMLAITFAATQAHAANIQMLPPIQNPPVESTKPTDPCTGSDGNKVLTWDGTEAIKCNKDLKFDTTNAKLDVAGGIKVGGDAAACKASKTGTIRLSGTTLQYCDGTTWKGIGGFAPTNEDQCGKGTLVQWDPVTKTTSCKPIFEAMDCYTATASAAEMPTITCNPGYYVISGSCWRTERPGHGVGGLFIGDRVSKSPTGYICRIEGANAANATATCCR